MTSSSQKPIKQAPKKQVSNRDQSFYSSVQSRFANAKLIQNLGSYTYGAQFNFTSDLRTAYGRD